MISDEPEHRVKTFEDASAEISSLWKNVEQLSGRVRTTEKMLDTRNSPLWKRVLFRLDGWPAWTTVAEKPAWRPWRRWWRS